MAAERTRRFAEDDEAEQVAQTGIRAFVAARLGRYQDPAIVVGELRDWIDGNRTRAIVYAAIAALVALVLFGLVVWKIVEIRTRPTLMMALAEFDYGAYMSADQTCDRLLGFTSKKDTAAIATIFLIKGASLANLTDVAWTKERQSYYRAAAGFLQLAEQLGFPTERAAMGNFYLGKCYYLAGDVARARQPLLKALELQINDPRSIHWYLANSAFYAANSDFEDALKECDLYCRTPTTAVEERDEGMLLKSMILVRLGHLDEAEKIFNSTPKRDHLQVMRTFVEGQLRLEQARVIKDRADAIAKTTFFPNGASPATSLTPVPSQSTPTPAPSPEDTIPLPDDTSEPRLPLPTSSSDAAGLSTTSNARDRAERTLWHEVDAGEVVPHVYHTTAQQAALAPSPQTRTGPVRTTPVFTSAPTNVGPPPSVEIVEVNTDDDARAPAPLPPTVIDEPVFRPDPVAQAVDQTRQDAIARYEQAIACMGDVAVLDPGDFPWAASALLISGVCYDELATLRLGNDASNAALTFQELLQEYPERPEATAAEFVLAEQAQRSGDVKNAMALYYRAFRQISPNVAYINAWFPRDEFMRRAQTTFDQYVAAKDFPMALEFLEAWKMALPNSEYYRYGAYTIARWGDELNRLASAAVKDKQELLARDTRSKYKVAGAWFERLAQYDFTEPHFVNLLWSSAEYYRHGWDYPNAIRMYQRYLEYNITERQFEAKFHIATMWLHLDYLDRAIDDFTKLLAEDTRHPLAATARLWLAKAHFEKKEWDAAQQNVVQNLSSDYAPGSTLYGNSLYLLGAIDYQKKDYAQAMIHLEDAVSLHPSAPQAAEANYTLALCHLANVKRLQAIYETTVLERPRGELRSQIAAEHAAAGDCFQRTERLLAARQDVANLSTGERLLQRNSIFGIGEMLMRRGLYEEASLVYNSMASRYGEEPSALYALTHLAAANEKLGRLDDAQAAFKHADHLLATLRTAGKFPPDFRFTEDEWTALLDFEKTVTRVHDIPIPESSMPEL